VYQEPSFWFPFEFLAAWRETLSWVRLDLSSLKRAIELDGGSVLSRKAAKNAKKMGLPFMTARRERLFLPPLNGPRRFDALW
jgi:hypothetical protein